MYEFKTLNGVSFEELERVFNLAFSKYYLHIHFSKEQLEQKYNAENGNWDLSVGVFENGELIGFIMHYFDERDNEKVIYNGGTGVVPSKWGHGLGKKMYEFIVPKLKDNGIDRMVLEVLSVNDPAIKVYEQIGFEKVRSLNCYKGVLEELKPPSGYDIRDLEDYDWPLMKSFWDYEPTWQNSILTMNNLKTINAAKGIYLNDQLVGYIIYNPKSNRIHQMAIDKNQRRNGLGYALVTDMIFDNNGTYSIINVDDRLSNADTFLSSLGMEKFLVQNEMTCKIL